MGYGWESESDEDWRETWLGEKWAGNPDIELWRGQTDEGDLLVMAVMVLEENPQTGRKCTSGKHDYRQETDYMPEKTCPELGNLFTCHDCGDKCTA